MSTFILKIIALLTMLIDHSSILLYEISSMTDSTYFLLRGIGRIAFPIYAFLLVKGFNYTHDRKKYIFRLMLLALISQIPFSLYFSHSIQPVFSAPQLSFSAFGPLVTAALWLTMYFSLTKQHLVKELLLVLCFTLLPAIKLSFGNIYVLDGHMSIFYSLSLGLCAVYYLSRLRERALNPQQNLLCFLALASALYFIQRNADYGLSAVILVLGLYLLSSRHLGQIFYIMLWAFFQYGYSGVGLMYSLFACLSAALLFFYNGRKGPDSKLFFYGFYPMHLGLLALAAYISLG